MACQLLLVISVSFGILSAEGFLHQYPKLDLRGKIDDDCANPLILTQYIESGDIAEGRRLARVPFTENLNITSFSGFFTVDKTYSSNQFFWYFPAMSNAKEAPVILWLQGERNVVSSLTGLFIENGPLIVKNDTLEKREFHWALDHHLIYIDSPVGIGFSFTNDYEGYCTSIAQVGEHLYSSIVQFFQIFPELQSNNFFVTGESYGGKYVPALAYTIHKNNPTAALKINLKGLAMGNGWSDPINQLVYGDFLNQLGFIDWNQLNEFERVVTEIKYCILVGSWIDAKLYYLYLLQAYFDLVGRDSFNNYNQIGNDTFDLKPILSNSVIRKGLHVGHLPFIDFNPVNFLSDDCMQSIAPKISELLDHYNVLTYNGQLDVIVAYPLTVNYLRQLNFTGSEEYETAKRHIWRVDGEVAGYVKTAGRLVEAMVRNAGHLISRDQPKWALDLITRFTHEKPFYDSN